MVKLLRFYCILLASITLYGQSSNPKNYIETEYKKYFELPRESIYLHFNKSNYVYGEDIWFKGYIYDQINEIPSLLSANVYVDIYDAKGEKVKSNLFLGYNGFLRGNFRIDNSLTTGTYYIKAYTNWMKNFKESNAYTTQIQIINETKPKKSSVESLGYDIQFLPESGHALTNNNNNFGVKIVDSKGQGVKIAEGYIVENDTTQVRTFTTNQFGLGSVSVMYNDNATYAAVIRLDNGKQITTVLPKGEINGVNFEVHSNSKNNFYFTFNKTATTPGNTYKLLIHKDGFSRSVNIRFKDKLNTNISISKNSLFDGINILTLFNSNNQPIAERLIYNHSPQNSEKKIRLVYDRKVKDSLSFRLSIPKHLSNYYNLSVSVLPSKTESYNHVDNIVSNFKLLPYLKGNIEQPRYYFTETNREKLYDLDLLLLTQGWSRYAWDDIFNNKPKRTYKFEYGLTLTGRVKGANAKSVFLGGLRNNNGLIKQIDTSQTFKIDNIFPETNEFIQLTFSLDKKKRKGQAIASGIPTVSHQLLYLKDSITSVDVNSIRNRYNAFDTSYTPFLNTFISNNTIFTPEAFYLDGQNQVIKSKPLRRGKSIIADDINTQTTDLITLIDANGFKVENNSGVISKIKSPKSTINPREKSPLIYIDDVPLSNLNALSTLDLSLIDEILLDPFALTEDPLSPYSGVISIYSKATALSQANTKRKFPFHTIRTKKGFAPYKTFYNPKYAFYQSSGYEKYGVIHWFSDVLVEPYKRETLKIPNHNQGSISFYIEGMSDSGDLISEVITVTIPEKK